MDLMSKKIQHIYRSATITLLMLGFLAHLIVPFSSQAQKTAFTRWLDHNVVASGNESEVRLRNTIRELPEQAGDFWILVKEASELIASHQDHFKITVTNSPQTETQDRSGWLIDQWNIFQNQKSGFNSVLVESVKSLSNWIPQNTDFSFVRSNSVYQQVHFQKELFFDPAPAIAGSLQPLINGISINAP